MIPRRKIPNHFMKYENHLPNCFLLVFLFDWYWGLNYPLTQIHLTFFSILFR
jgi:hypothetical protein